MGAAEVGQGLGTAAKRAGQHLIEDLAGSFRSRARNPVRADCRSLPFPAFEQLPDRVAEAGEQMFALEVGAGAQ
jgi:hypothetical protein